MDRRSLKTNPKLIAAVLAAALVLAALGSSQSAWPASAPRRQSPHHSDPRSAGQGPLAGLRLWVNPNTPAARQQAAWRRSGKTADAALVARIAAQPTAIWLTGGNAPAQQAQAIVNSAQRAHAIAQIVLYDIPDRDCGQYSSGGAPNADDYLTWVREVASGLGSHPAIVILEPDAIDQAASGCLGSAGASQRYATLASAASLLRHDPGVHIYLDAGHAGWLTPQQIIEPLKLSGVADDSGFSLNVANFFTTSQSVSYGRRLSTMLNGKHFVIDTSRNGDGAPITTAGVNRWCNPPGRALGHTPTTDTGNALTDAFLWIKYPGQSDGSCSPGEPPAGRWWPTYALGLVRTAAH